MHYQEFAPAAALRPLVDCYWQFRVPPAEAPQPIPHTVLPDGGVSLVWFRAQPGAPPLVVWAGPRTQNYQQPVWPGSVFSGVRFVPGAPHALFGLDMTGLKNQTRPVGAELARQPVLAALAAGLSTEPLRPARLDDALLRAALPPPDALLAPLVARILAAQGRVRIAELLAEAPLSARPLQRRFKLAVGLTMKELARVRRLRATVIQLLLREDDYFGTLEAAGYFDQAHFSHEFAQSAGTPLREFRDYIRGIHHTDVG